ncbi:MAG TPA: hypothetical protein VFT87_04865, partial [Candidatus Saccharimonadales bacterium]|nr:hypothetical protein [Candidatus Saccharimonadales bacterium]
MHRTPRSADGFTHFILLIFVIIVIAVVGLAGYFVWKKQSDTLSSGPKAQGLNLVKGEQVDNQGCEGSGPVQFGVSPMDPKDVGIILPYGGMVGAHVTPIDHMYFSPVVFNSPRDTYEVRAMADGLITGISERTQNVSDVNNGSPKKAEYQMKFWYTCDFASYYDLVTSLSPRLKAEFDAHRNGSYASVQIKVKAGEVVGRIGGQTLDFAVYDYTKILPGFIVPEHYLAESWKLHVVDPFQYFTEPVKSQLLALDVRQAEPREGKLDYDLDGKLVGTWFKEGNNGFGETGGQNAAPWRAHLSFVYDSIDPSMLIVSIGDYGGQSQQFAVKGNTPDPATVSEGQLIEYELVQPDHY